MTEPEKNSEDDIQTWLDQVHYGSCCSDEPDTCEKVPEKPEKDISEDEPANS